MGNYDYRYYRDAGGVLYRIHIEPDEIPWNPRTDMDGNIGTMFCMHRRYRLGDNTPYRDEDGLKRAIITEMNIPIEDDLIDGITLKDLQAIAGEDLILFPLYLYDHSDLTMSIADFGDPWDSGQVGVSWTTLDKVKGTRPGKKKKKEWLQIAKEDLKAEVKMYDMYLQGEVYGYVEETLNESGQWEESDSCWGFYSDSADPLCELADEVWGAGNHTKDMPHAA